ncbi:HAD-IIIA family hydrolase [Actinoplanes sp. LDG1-06]|uniref:D,D-heptose 1,7-bisphosphate phosphatase n=1 Tax=Paractinoplanes ovalisporus TaxID=2810368 RepID=A0ABS2AQK6_9ACTN|nr:HAD-IIIA family hydrolase [Actinoplanes ovalisporus]MBM2621469.1 HAD-IIIA family hydrolase [Actinoplanes ovalisporus]
MSRLFDAVLFDRDGTLIVDVPYNGDPAKVEPMPGAREALDRLRAAGLRVGVVTNQSGLARGRFDAAQLQAVHRRVGELLGPFDTWQFCPHDDTAGCRCRKPAPGLVEAAAEALGTTPARCVMVGDIGRDVEAAQAAGAAAILVPTPVTLPGEVAAAPVVAGTLTEAADLILRRVRLQQAPVRARGGTVLVVRSDSAGDVLVTGPAVRAVAAGADRVVLLCGPRGRSAAELLPGVDEIVEWRLPWIDPQPGPVDPPDIAALTERLRGTGAGEAVVFTSFHQSALPLALLMRMAGIGRITAISEDYPGSLLDVRHRVPDDLPEPERARSVAAAAGFALPAGDDGRLRVTGAVHAGPGRYVVVHPGASCEARACPPGTMRAIVAALTAAGHRVLVTAGPGEHHLAAYVAGNSGETAGRTSMAELTGILAGATAVVVANTGPAHLAAAVGTPVVSLYAPTVPYGRWGPYRVPTVRLGDAAAPCRDTRATTCPVDGHPCLSTVEPAAVVTAVARLATPAETTEAAA